MTVVEPTRLLEEWLDEARAAGHPAGFACTLCTATATGCPSGRVVALKPFDGRGYRFFTRATSGKARDLAENAAAAAVLYVPVLDRQVRIEGETERLPGGEVVEYFRSRPRAQQLALASSAQSTEQPAGLDADAAMRALERELAGGAVPVPEDLLGYRLVPAALEFLQHRRDTFAHERTRYERDGSAWRARRLAP